MNVATHVLVSFLPVVLYLAVMTFTAVGLGKVPFWAHPALIIPGLVVRALTADTRSDVAITAAAGTLLFLGGVFFLARVVSGATLFTVVGAFTLAPLWIGYAGVVTALVAAGLFTGWQTAHRLGGQHVRLMAWQTAFAFGVSPAGLSAPDPEAVPGKRAAGVVVTEDRTVGALSIQPFLLAGVLVAMVLSVTLA